MPCGTRALRIKICGVTRAEDVAACADAGVDFVGFNVWPGSPRHVEPERAATLAAALPPAVTPVAVCVWTDPASVEAARACGFAWIQVHETPTGWRWSEREADTTIVRALRAERDLTAGDLAGGHYYLVDAPGPGVGGTGRAFDWSRLAAVAGDERLFLAGGLRPDNVAEAVAAVRPYAVDVASGVEQSPGIKDVDLITAFVRAARNGKA